MYCMKCGREMDSEQAFCEDCLLDMEKYPVKPGTAVHLPIRKNIPATRKPAKRRAVSPEEQVARLKKRIWFLTGALMITVLLLLCMVQPTMEYFVRNYHLRPGQNYQTAAPSTAAPTETEETTLPPDTTEDPWAGFAD